MPTVTTHADYMAAAPEAFRPVLKALHDQLASALPDADEVIEYGMPGFRVGGSVVAGYAAFSRQCGLYVSPAAITAHAGEIAAAGLKATKTGVTFSQQRPIPDALVRQLAKSSRDVLGV